MGTKAITAAALTKYYGKARGIDGLDLEVETGDFFGFIGPNGAGKSTTIRTLLGLISPTSGKAQVLGLDIEKDSRAILQRVGYLPSDTAFYNGMKVREILKKHGADRLSGIDPKEYTGFSSPVKQTITLSEGGRPLLRQPEKGRHRLRPAARPGTPDPGRAYRRPGPPDAA